MNALSEAQRFGIKTYLINTTYQDMPDEYDKVLKNMTFLSVRELASFQYIRDKGIRCQLFPDLSINNLVPRQGASVGKNTCIGQAHPDVEESVQHISHFNGEKVNLNDRSMQETINYLYWNCKKYITGEYHGLICALMAGCYVVPFPSNSWKIQGLMMWAKALKIHPKELLLTEKRLRRIPE